MLFVLIAVYVLSPAVFSLEPFYHEHNSLVHVQITRNFVFREQVTARTVPRTYVNAQFIAVLIAVYVLSPAVFSLEPFYHEHNSLVHVQITRNFVFREQVTARTVPRTYVNAQFIGYYTFCTNTVSKHNEVLIKIFSYFMHKCIKSRVLKVCR